MHGSVPGVGGWEGRTCAFFVSAVRKEGRWAAVTVPRRDFSLYDSWYCCVLSISTFLDHDCARGVSFLGLFGFFFLSLFYLLYLSGVIGQGDLY